MVAGVVRGEGDEVGWEVSVAVEEGEMEYVAACFMMDHEAEKGVLLDFRFQM